MHLGLNKTTQFYLRPQKFILDLLIFSNIKKATISLVLLILSSSFLGQSNLLAPISIDFFSTNYPNYEFENFIYVGIKRQKMYVFKHQEIVACFPISSSKRGVGNTINSFKTPTGLHKINTKYGFDVPYGGIFEHRKFKGKIATICHDSISTGKDIICSRILRLEGLERGINKDGRVDSYNRKIYIHGTNEEGLIGTKASHGCIRMKNKDIIDLYNITAKGMLVIIIDN